jgi:hypothetical protein
VNDVARDRPPRVRLLINGLTGSLNPDRAQCLKHGLRCGLRQDSHVDALHGRP